jgi:hypothetical protein
MDFLVKCRLTLKGVYVCVGSYCYFPNFTVILLLFPILLGKLTVILVFFVFFFRLVTLLLPYCCFPLYILQAGFLATKAIGG